MMKAHVFEKKTIIGRPLKEVFDFFSKTENLDRLTPPYLNFKIITPLPIKMRAGALIRYKLKLYGLPFSWTTKIIAWEPPFRFEDSQLQGPYRKWVHEHLFKEINGEVHMHDRLTYQSPGWFLEPLIHALFVRRNVERIFNYREKALKELFG